MATPLERALGTIAGVNEIRSDSSQGSTRVNIQFDLGKDINNAAREVQAAINASRSLLPSALPGMPSYRKINPSQAPISDSGADVGHGDAPSQLYDLASTVLAQKVASGDRRRRRATVGGGSLPAVRVELDPRALTPRTASSLRRRPPHHSAGDNRPAPKGIDRGRRSLHWQMQASDQLDAARRIRAADRHLSQRRAGAADRRLEGDRRRRGSLQHRLLQRPAGGAADRQPPAGREHHQDRRRRSTSSCRRCARSCRATCTSTIASDRSPSIRTTLREAERTLLIAVALVILVVLLFLASIRAAIIPVAAVPVSLIGAFGVMYLWGFSLNNLSLMALIVATGLVVDDAIVVLENIQRHRRTRPAAGAGGDARRAGSGRHAALDEPRAGRRVRLDAVHGRHRRAPVPGVLDHAGGGDPDLARSSR